MTLRLKRAYEPASKSDGRRYLIDRLWPRGVRKEELVLTDWLKDLAPSTELRRWFGHDPSRWDEFQTRYREELKTPQSRALLQRLAGESRQGEVTLVYGAKDSEHNDAIVLRQVVEEHAGDTGN